MTVSKYAVSISLSSWEVERLVDNPGYMDHLKRKMRTELGLGLVEAIENEIKKPTVVRLEWQEIPHAELDAYRLALVAYVQPTETMRVVIPEFPEMQFSYFPVSGGRIPIEWQCGYCGQTNLVEQHLECRKCGAPRSPIR